MFYDTYLSHITLYFKEPSEEVWCDGGRSCMVHKSQFVPDLS